jgi:hypothetical protein
LFTLEVDGVPYIVSTADWMESFGTIEVYATDPEKPTQLEDVGGDYLMIDGPGLDADGKLEQSWNGLSAKALLGRTVTQYCLERIRATLSEKVRDGSRLRAARFAVPESVYRLPASRDEGRFGPIEVTKAELEAVRPTESMVKRGVTHAEIHDALFQINLGSGIIANNKLADELLEQKLVAAKARYGFKLVKAGKARLETYMAMAAAAAAADHDKQALAAVQADIDTLRDARGSWPAGHVVSMTIDHDSGEQVGTCECGFVARVPRDGTTRAERLRRALEHDRLVEAHWASVEAGPNPPAQEGLFDGERAPPAAAPIAADVEAIPDFLKVKNRRGNAKVAAQ